MTSKNENGTLVASCHDVIPEKLSCLGCEMAFVWLKIIILSWVKSWLFGIDCALSKHEKFCKEDVWHYAWPVDISG